MPSRDLRPTLADYVAAAICPTLIIALVVSLIYFLLEVLYVGQYPGRLQWIFFFFVFAAVFVARMSMGDAGERAGLYGTVLAIVMMIALQVLVDYPPDSPLSGFHWLVNLALMAMVWWCAHRLTWDCTFIDESVESSGAGLLEAAGLEGPQSAAADDDAVAVAEGRGRRRKKKKAGLAAWWERYQAYREKKGKLPHSPGVWIIYFSLAALPLFGLGQSFIPPEDVGRRQYVFWLMAIYVASGLGLLLTTSFLGLRRYLRQRKLTMPITMTTVWLSVGGAMILVLLVLGALLPRPNAEYPLVEFGSKASPNKHDASRYAMGGGKAGKGEGRSTADEAQKDPQGNKSEPGSKGDKQNDSGGSQQQGSKQGQDQSKGEQGKESRDQQSSRNSDANQEQKDAQGQKDQRADQQTQRDSKAEADRNKDGDKGKAKDDGSSSANSPKVAPLRFPSLLSSIPVILKWIVFGIVALVVGFVVVRAVLKFLANFTDWAKGMLAALQGLWRALFGWWLPSAKPAPAAPEEDDRPPPQPFSAYRNPFWDGGDSGRSPEELVRYSFEAMQAWARERGLGRELGETPLEFSSRLGADLPALDADGRRLAALYARSAYARGRLPASATDAVRQFWHRLEEADEAPLSA